MAAASKDKTKKVKRRPRNPTISKAGLTRYSKSRTYKRRTIYKKKELAATVSVDKTKKSKYVVKTIGGEKNGEVRKVRVERLPRHIPTQEATKKLKNNKKPFSQHKRYLRKSISPGSVLILLAGRHKGKRVVFLKQFPSGLLLVTGPFVLNGCPLRRINQIYVVATSTKINISKVKLPERLTDGYFRRKSLKNQKHREVELFDTTKEEYTLSKERKDDQLEVDKQVIAAVKQHSDKKYLKGYLESMFSLKNKMYPHKMLF